MVDRREANLKTLNDASEVQEKTKEAIWRIQRQANEAEQIGVQTIDELRRQGQQMDDINHELNQVDTKLEQSKALQSRFDRWAGNWIGGKKNKAMKEAAAEIADRNLQEYSKVKEVFQHQKYDSISRSWKKVGLVLCSDPTVPCEDLFDPALQEKMENSHWTVDFSLQGIDPEGWTYAYDFATLNRTGAGESTPKWNTYVRRRKWRYVETRGGATGALGAVHERNEARKAKASANNSSRQAEKIGYVPRGKQTVEPTQTGLSSSRSKDADQQLDAESAAGLARLKAADAEIDAGVDAIARSIDNLGNIAGQMRDEVVNQNTKLEYIDNNMEKVVQKQTVVNARQRYLLK